MAVIWFAGGWTETRVSKFKEMKFQSRNSCKSPDSRMTFVVQNRKEPVSESLQSWDTVA
ncbi:hypothetical protein DES53_102554 [Roseimicrobium gellanilyticum]|uniref:Uncharacterized protein n=1 Tax=Roseimicrobium gellanilyticum TaxID=748857 RepID=A0A366HST4_9BACT|nr:hypothetical protein DES53_102554 [Roseimicrobium gellanilyticum]